MPDAAPEPLVRGPRVDLVPFSAGDLDAVHAFASDPEVCRYTTWGPNTLAETRAFLDDALRPHPGRLLLAVHHDGDVVGSAAVWTTSTTDRSGELGYTLRRDRWGRGLGTEVARLLVDLGFGRLRLERLAATCDPDNAASVRVLEKAGLRREGLLRGHVLVRGRRRDSLLLARLASDGPLDGAPADGVLEQALLPVRPGREQEFLDAFARARPLIAGTPGFLGLSLSRCLERPGHFLLLVRWRRLEDHTEGFRGSPQYQDWRRLLHHFYEPFPEVLHFEAVTGTGGRP